MAVPLGGGALILLNGTSSAGKTTLARAIQRIADTPWLRTGLDAFFATVPERWGGGEGGPLSVEGFRYDENERDPSGHPLVTIRYGPVGKRMLHASHRSVVAMVDAGQDVLADELLLADEVLDDWLDVLRGRDVFFVGVTCDLDVLEGRERARGNRAGLARGHLRTVHPYGLYDLQVDTTATPPDDLAQTILSAWKQRGETTAFDLLRARRLPGVASV